MVLPEDRPPVDRREVLDRLREAAPELRRRFGVKEMALIGSFARGEADAASDVDILVTFERLVSLFEVADLEEDLEGRLGRHVDVVMRDGLPARLRERVERDAIAVS